MLRSIAMPSVVSPDKIAARAYEIWEAEGRPEGRDLDHWIKAASEVTPAKPKKKAAANGNGKAKPVAAAPAPAKVPAKAPAKAKRATKKA